MAIKILIVEDEPAIADNLQALLRAKGYDASCALDGPEGVELARKLRPDIILLDIMLPKLSGVEVCSILKAEERTKSIRIVMVTGLGRTGDVEAAFAAGADDYLIKPYDTERLFKKIQKVLSASGPA